MYHDRFTKPTPGRNAEGLVNERRVACKTSRTLIYCSLSLVLSATVGTLNFHTKSEKPS
jgi:hypothetical protein